jgi:gliding motility-associated-like protein
LRFILTIGFWLLVLFAKAQQEARYFQLYGQYLRVDSSDLVPITALPPALSIGFPPTPPDIMPSTARSSLSYSCDGGHIDQTKVSVLGISRFFNPTIQNRTAFVDTPSLFLSRGFPDPTRDSVFHALIPVKTTWPEFAQVERVKLVTYNRYSLQVMRSIDIADSVGFGMQAVFRHHDRKNWWIVCFRRIDDYHYQPYLFFFDGHNLANGPAHAPVYLHQHVPAYLFQVMVSPDEKYLCVNPANGSYTLFKINRRTGQLHSQINVDIQSLFARPFPGVVHIQALAFSPNAKKMLAFSTDYRRYPFRYRFYQIDLANWDSVGILRNVYSRPWVDETISDFVSLPNNKTYYFQFNPLTERTIIGEIVNPEAPWNDLRMYDFWLSPANGPAVEQLGKHSFPFTLEYYRSPKRYSVLFESSCSIDSISFSLNEIRKGTYFTWDMGDGTVYQGDTLYDLKHKYREPGRYPIHITAVHCAQTVNIRDTVTVFGPPETGQGDTLICNGIGFQVELNSQVRPVLSATWSDGDSSLNKRIGSSGWWWVDLQGICGAARDSFYVSYDANPNSGLPADTSFCIGTTAELVHSSPFFTATWPDGSTDKRYVVKPDETLVTLQKTNHCGNWIDTIRIHWQRPLDWISVDTVLCQGEKLLLPIPDDGFVQVRWSDADTTVNRVHQKEYEGYVQITNACGQETYPISIRRERCDCELWLPSAFSPNGDGLNDSYVATPECEASLFELYIYDRWGRLVFETTNPNQGWDGTFGGQPLPEGQYAVKARYVGQYTRELKTPGTFLYLIR